MSVFSTVKITRAKTQRFIIEKVLSGDDDLLAHFADYLLEDRLYNVRIVNDDAPNDDSLIGL